MADFSPLQTFKRLATGRGAPPEPKMLGRFELRRILGRGAQAVVWLAFDPRLEREVAIKLMKVDQGADATAVAHWLQEARSVSRLKHPQIVPVFEADVRDQQPYLVFEYAQGQTLAAVLAKRGALPPTEAVALMMDVLDALIVAHAAGIVHRDLKPSNVLVDEAGRARVMDFGIAARVQDPDGAGAGSGVSVPAAGTPGYVSPEAARGAPPTPLMDIFSAGIVLAEMLSGKSLIGERDPARAISKVLHEQLTLPSDLSAEVDDGLRAIVMRALERDPAQRHGSSRVFRDELGKWASATATPPQGLAGSPRAHGSGTLDFLLRRMRHKSDFPALSDAVVRIQGIANSDTESIGSVTNEILKDVALTNKLLRVVNSAFYARGSSIGTVSRAVSLVGLNGIRNMALSLVLLEHMQDKAHANVLKEEFLRSLMAGSIASEFCAQARGHEEAFIGAMFHSLGRLLAAFYFPEEARTVRGLTASTRQPVTEASASASVLGLSFEELGIGVAKAWGLPAGIQRCMRQPLGPPPPQASADPDERQRWMALAANGVADILLHTEPQEVDIQLAQLGKHYAKTLGISASSMQSATLVARKKFIEMASAMDITVLPGCDAAKLLQVPDVDTLVRPKTAGQTFDALAPLELHATEPMSSQLMGKLVVVDNGQHVAQTLAAGIQDITNAMVDEFHLSDVLRMILETMFRAMNFQRIIFCMRDAKTDALTGRFGLGEGIERMVKSFDIPLKMTTKNLFTAVCLKGADTMISDASEGHIADHLPLWYRQKVNAPTFLLLPLLIKGKPLGLIYADKGEKSGLTLDEKELAMLRTLRNQAVMAFKHSV